MSASPACPDCGATLGADAPDGLCPRCLIRAALGEAIDVAAARVAAAQGMPSRADLTLDWSRGPRSGDGPPLLPDPGASIRYLGDYELARELGRGGMGVVYEARQRSLNRTVAVKMIRSERLADEEDVRRFRREAEAAAQLDHPSIVPIYEVGTYQGLHYFSMKYVPGADLAMRLPEFAADPRRGAQLLAKVARAVQHSHERGILHRDLKPSNILLDPEDRPYVTDFGLAKWLDASGNHTQTLSVAGTPAYMAPEQIASRWGKVTVATDVYGLGAVLYSLLTGHAPFRAMAVGDLIQQVTNAPPVAPSEFDPDVDRDLEAICLSCLRKDPLDRYGSADEVADDLDRWLAGEPVKARGTCLSHRFGAWLHRNKAGIAAACVLLVVLAGLSIMQARRASLQRSQAEREQFLVWQTQQSDSVRAQARERLQNRLETEQLQRSIAETQESLERYRRIARNPRDPVILKLQRELDKQTHARAALRQAEQAARRDEGRYVVVSPTYASPVHSGSRTVTVAPGHPDAPVAPGPFVFGEGGAFIPPEPPVPPDQVHSVPPLPPEIPVDDVEPVVPKFTAVATLRGELLEVKVTRFRQEKSSGPVPVHVEIEPAEAGLLLENEFVTLDEGESRFFRFYIRRPVARLTWTVKSADREIQSEQMDIPPRTKPGD